jgi:hypothetical protein
MLRDSRRRSFPRVLAPDSQRLLPSRQKHGGDGRIDDRQVTVERDGDDAPPAHVSVQSRRRLRLLDADLATVHRDLAVGYRKYPTTTRFSDHHRTSVPASERASLS